MAKKYNALSFPIHVSSEVERLFDETIQRPWGFGSAMRCNRDDRTRAIPHLFGSTIDEGLELLTGVPCTATSELESIDHAAARRLQELVMGVM